MNDDPGRQQAPKPSFVPVCAIGASAGGVTALQGLFRQLPANLGLAYVVILHLSPDYPSAMDDILATCTRMPVLQIDDGPTLKPNTVFVIPPDRELVIEGDNVTARPFTEPRGRRAPIDKFFRSIAAARGDGIAVVLSGAGADGAQGVRAVKEAGGVIMVQEPAEAGFAPMPQNAIATGVADFVAPLARLAERLAEVAHSKEAVRSLDMDGGANDLRRIVAFLRARTGHDFSSYKRATVTRRVVRRMQVCRTDTLAAYADYLLTTPEEAKELFSDLLISVTMFFRDPRAFEALEHHIVKPLFDDLDPGTEDGIRAWVVGCATGEEAYSVAMLLHEEAARRKLHPHVQIFATDLDEGALATAREGRYPRTIEADVSEERLTRFFVDEGTHYRVRKELRDSVLFASHSVIKEPPFLRLDLVTCRNLLIYLERSLQQQLCAVFNYGLKPGRFLFLGSAETADVATDMFVPLDRDARIYRAKPHAAGTLPTLPQFAVPERLAGPDHPPPARDVRADLPAALHAAALERAAPPNVLVDDGQNVMHLSPSAGRFTLLSAGPVSSQLPALVRPELRLDLRLALIRALDANEPTLTHPTVVAMEGGHRRVAMHVLPVPHEAHMGAQALVVFLDGGPAPSDGQPEAALDTRPDEVRRLHVELKAAQAALVASRSGHEAAIQDFRTTNEELQSVNEEYRSTAEELETSKEELQSINEELHTVNAELKSKLGSISIAHSDLQNLTAATEIGTLFLDPELRIRMFTSPIAELFNVTKADIGRRVTDFTHRLEYDGLEADVRRVLADLVPVEAEVQSKGGQWYAVRLRPYRTVEDRIDGTVVTFVDITARREAEAARRSSEAQFRAFVTASSDGVYRMSPDWSRMHQLDGHGFLADTAEPNESWMEHYILADDRKTIQGAINEAIWTRGLFELEHRVRRVDGTIGWTLSRAVPILDEQGRITEWLGAAKDVTTRREAEEALRASEARLAAVFEVVPIGLGIIDPAGRLVLSNPEMRRFMPEGTTPSRHPDRLWRWQAQDADGRPLRPADFPDNRAMRGETVMPGIEMLYVLDDGREIWTQVAAVPIRNGEGGIIGQVPIVADIDALKRGGDALRESEQRLRTLMEGIPQLVWRAGDDGLWTWSSPQWQAFTGQSQEQSHGWGWLDVVHPDDHEATRQAWHEARPHGRLDVEYRVRRAADNAWRWHATRSVPVRGAAGPDGVEGRILEWLGTTTDIEDLKRLQGQQGVLVAELQHRTRNLLAVMRNVARRSIASSPGLDEYDARLAALGRVQGFLSRSTAYAVPLADVVQAELEAAGDGMSDRVTVDGPAVELPGESMQAVALALHELATNAVKYGAIAQPSGRLLVKWHVEATDGEDGRHLVIDWRESGVAMPPGPPARRGYGSELITRALPYQLHAETALEFTSDGVRCRVVLPANAFSSPDMEGVA